MNAWIAWILSLPAFAALSLAMPRHQEQVFGVALSNRANWAWRVSGVTLLVLALIVCLQSWVTSVALAAWLGVLTFAALTVGLILSYGPRWMLHLAGGALMLGLLAWAASLA